MSDTNPPWPPVPMPADWTLAGPGHDDQCESEFVFGPMAMSPCACDDRATMARFPTDCPRPIRVDGDGHSWRFDGDDPYIVCFGCDEMRDALTGRVIRAGRAA